MRQVCQLQSLLLHFESEWNLEHWQVSQFGECWATQRTCDLLDMGFDPFHGFLIDTFPFVFERASFFFVDSEPFGGTKSGEDGYMLWHGIFSSDIQERFSETTSEEPILCIFILSNKWMFRDFGGNT